jgi:hypothetical protein
VNKSREFTGIFLRALLLSALLVAAPVWAAEKDPPAQSDDAEQSTEELEAVDIAESSDAEIAAVDDSDAPGDPADEGRARFIPTEEISQDLGVSFPVDI